MLKQTKSLFISGLILFSSLIFSQITATPVFAVSGSDFNAGRIIDDAVFYDHASMDVYQIQQFLNSKVPNCDREGVQPYAGTTRRAYSEARGEVMPMTCLKDYYENPSTKENNLQGRGIPAGAQSAAQIIYDAAQQYDISPKVLIVLLQKEQGLITDDWPWVVQYRSATGYGCPDTALCDAEYYGFYNQVSNAARQFRRYASYPNQYNHVPNTDNYIRWSPNSACGGSTVRIENQATASLYNYTPYRPNQAALDNLYGNGDECSAYGNRNFWRYYSDWFGSGYTSFSTSKLSWGFDFIEGSASTIASDPSSFGKFSKNVTIGNILHVFYYDETNGRLRHAWYDNGWHFATMDGDAGANGQIEANVGGYIETKILNDKLYVAYYDYTNGDLRLAESSINNISWSIQTLDGAGGESGRYTNDIGKGIAMSNYGTSLQLFYYDASWGNLRHAWLSGDQWNFENLDGDSSAVARNDGNQGQTPVAGVISGTLQLFYYDADRGNLRHAWVNSCGWHFEDLDGSNESISHYGADIGLNPTLIEYGNTLQLFYYDIQQKNLRHAWANSTGWHFEDLDGDTNAISGHKADIGRTPQAVVFKNDLYIIYHDSDMKAIKMAYADWQGWHFSYLDGINTSLSRSGNPVGNIDGNAASVGIYGDSLQVYYQDRNTNTLRHAWGNNY